MSKKENIILFGAGNHSIAIINVIEKEQKYNIIGFVDSIRKKNSLFKNYKVLGRQEDILEITKKYSVYKGFVSIGDNYTRFIVTNYILSKLPNFQFVNVIHPSVLIENNTILGKGIALMPNTIVNPGSIIEDGCFINSNSSLGQSCLMKEFSSLSAGVTLGGQVVLNKRVAILIGAVLFDRLSIGEDSVVGGGSLVTKSFSANSVIFGSPAKIIRKRNIDEKYLK